MYYISNLNWYYMVLFAWVLLLPYSSCGQNAQCKTLSNGFSIESQNRESLTIKYTVPEYEIRPIKNEGTQYKEILLKGSLLPNQKGAPNLPQLSKIIAVPENAMVMVEYSVLLSEVIQDIEIAPSQGVPLQNEKRRLQLIKDQSIYENDTWYPEQQVLISDISQIRGVDVVHLGLTPFQYNPVNKELRIIKEATITLTFIGGNDKYGEERLQSRWWDPILQGIIFNSGVIEPAPTKVTYTGNETGCEYLIITPDNPAFLTWADSIKRFRTQQGIYTAVATTNEMGGNTVNNIEAYIDNAYNTWDVPPAAIMLLGDHGTDELSIVSPTVVHPYAGSCLSDNKYADVDEDGLPDITISRITARDVSELESTIHKFINYERNPPLSSDFYQHPTIVSGWEDYSWFQICSETMVGFFNNELGKSSVRINQIYDGNPSAGLWSTVPGTEDLVNYFGPHGLGYIPASPAGLTWTGGSGSQISQQINDGSFLTFYDDHGNVDSWGCPAYGMFQVRNLENTAPTFVFSLGCSTGKFDHYPECFAEAFHRQENGALSIIASTELAYKLVNEVYHWGTTDYLWPEFMPDYNSGVEHKFALTAFASTYGKYFLAISEWPYNYYEKEITYHLFHHHGDAFSALHTKIPQELNVTHGPEVLTGTESFSVTANAGSQVAITSGNKILGVAESAGEPIIFEFEALTLEDTLTVTVTKQDHIRYCVNVPVVDSHTAIYQTKKTPSFKISPNPTHDRISISTSEKIDAAEIKVFNTNMELLQSRAISWTQGSCEIIHMDNYKSGIYFVMIQTQQNFYVEKIIVQ